MLNSKQTKEMLLKVAELYIEKEDELSKLDAVIGDGDHGITMARGAKAAKEKLNSMDQGSCRDYFKAYGRTLVSTLGGAMGPLFGSIFLELSKACKEVETVGLKELAVGFENAQVKVMELGGAKVGDKTMVDSMDPVAKSLTKSVDENKDMKEGLRIAVAAADEGVKSTIPIVAKRGRSRYLQEKAIGHQDAGATSFYYLVKTISEYTEENV